MFRNMVLLFMKPVAALQQATYHPLYPSDFRKPEAEVQESEAKVCGRRTSNNFSSMARGSPSSWVTLITPIGELVDFSKMAYSNTPIWQDGQFFEDGNSKFVYYSDNPNRQNGQFSKTASRSSWVVEHDMNNRLQSVGTDFKDGSRSLSLEERTK
jgi:hypothetical protein